MINKYTIAQLKTMREADPETFAAQYMQSPMVATGNVFKREWFRYWDEFSLPRMFDTMFQSWDMTFKNTAHADNVCGQLWGKKGPNFYLLDCVCEKMTFMESLRHVIMMTEKYTLPSSVTYPKPLSMISWTILMMSSMLSLAFG